MAEPGTTTRSRYPRSDLVRDYMLSHAVIAVPLNLAIDELLVPLVEATRSDSNNPRVSCSRQSVSPYDSSACRRAESERGLVVLNAECW